MIVVTTPQLDGRTVQKYLGIVSGEAILGANLDYDTIQVGQGGGMLMVSASGTAVKV